LCFSFGGKGFGMQTVRVPVGRVPQVKHRCEGRKIPFIKNACNNFDEKKIKRIQKDRNCWNIQAIQRFCVLRTPARIHRDSITIRCTEYTFYLINLYLVTLYTLCSYFLKPHTLVSSGSTTTNRN
jgi:hypothetical protein